MALIDLPADALRKILHQLEPRDLCRCKSACRKFRSLTSEDSIWEAQCSRWFQRNGQHSGLHQINPDRLRTQLAYPSFAMLFQVLHSLGGWPEGLWYRVDMQGQPRGALVQIQLQGSTLRVLKLNTAAELNGSFCQILLDKLPVRIMIGLPNENHLVLPTDLLRINSRASTLMIQLARSGSDAGSKPPIIWCNEQGNHELDPIAAGSSNVDCMPWIQWLSMFGAWLTGVEPAGLSLWPHPLRLRRIIPLPCPLPHPDQPLPQLPAHFTAADALKRLAGLWKAWYGSHGPEMLHLWWEDSLQSQQQSAPPADEPDHMPRPRLLGCKVTGDPNVPANETSFRAQASGMKLGAWDGMGAWDGTADIFRPIVNFNGLPIFVDMRARQVVARFRCQGRINYDPADYKPLWVPAQLILYDGPQPMFSVLFDDNEQRFRHIMDFEPVPLPRTPYPSWASDPDA